MVFCAWLPRFSLSTPSGQVQRELVEAAGSAMWFWVGWGARGARGTGSVAVRCTPSIAVRGGGGL